MTTICRHIMTNGARCGSPALRNNPYCYFHRTIALSHPQPAPEPPTILHPLDGREPQTATQPSLHLPPLEDRESIQLAASMIVGALARNTLDTKRAVTLLYGLQVASANARKLNFVPSREYVVTETTLTPSGHEIAPDEEPSASSPIRNSSRASRKTMTKTKFPRTDAHGGSLRSHSNLFILLLGSRTIFVVHCI